ncbi:hypothetical protein GCM10022393_30030 [Aquimarina addita]|uniref:Putative auto-transporter adhesin head GIN domain-containing protein n=1 Tax=Aquimarina addita TaxID=870485 RepID=A0ABP6UQT9_9FLAO
MTTLIKFLVTLSLSALCYSCNFTFDGIKGEGEVTTREKTINKNFNTIKSSNGLDVVLTSKKDKKVVVEANENLHSHIEVYVKEEVLHITANKNIYQADKKTVYVSYDILNKIAATSGSEITSLESIVQKNLSINATSGANIHLDVKAETLTSSATSGAILELSGKVNNHNAKATSGANTSADNLLSMVSKAKATSGASIKIHAKNKFTGNATSGGHVLYYGNPASVSENDNSGGVVKRR